MSESITARVLAFVDREGRDAGFIGWLDRVRWTDFAAELRATAERESALRARVSHLEMLLLSLVRAMEAEIDTRRCRDSSLHVLNLARKEVP